MTESFEDARIFAQVIMSDCDAPIISRLQRAHDHEMAELRRGCDLAIEQARDPQRIGGTLERDSFAYAIEQLREFRWQHATNDDDAIPYINGVAKAHDHEMEQLRRSRFREGYEAGQRSMDAEHYAVALRLKHLPLDEDSHGNLSQIARAVWHSDFGWTKGACAALRDELVRLLGGVHDEPAQIPASRCACDADCDCHNQQPKAVAYDELSNERHKAVCELRSISDSYMTTGDAAQFVCDMANAINAEGCDSETIYKGLRDRLIHLLGGNTEPLPNFSEYNLPKSAETAKPENAVDGEVAITDELRKFKGCIKAELTLERVLELRAEINCIADRIDEQFDRCCELWERVAQDAIHAQLKAEQERDELKKKLDEYEHADTAESIVRDIHLGKVTDSQAIERIRALQ